MWPASAEAGHVRVGGAVSWPTRRPAGILTAVAPRIAWVTAAVARGHDGDEAPAVSALRADGVDVSVVDWHEPAVDWASFDLVVVRSAWDYAERVDDFRTWMRRVDRLTSLRNHLDVMEWGLDKHYLHDLAVAGVPTTPTTFVEIGEAAPFPQREFVVKPAIGAGSRDASSYAVGQEELARRHVAELHGRGSAVLVQPLLASVAEHGEWPMVFFGGEFSHAANKRVTLPSASRVGALFAPERNVPHGPSSEQLAVARAAVDVVVARFGAPTYARVDLVVDDAGRPCVLELEVVEPSLFLTEGGAAAVDRLVAALR